MSQERKGCTLVRKRVIRVIARVKEALEANGITIKRTILCRSYAQGITDEHSDIDIAVISDDFKGAELK